MACPFGDQACPIAPCCWSGLREVTCRTAGTASSGLASVAERWRLPSLISSKRYPSTPPSRSPKPSAPMANDPRATLCQPSASRTASTFSGATSKALCGAHTATASGAAFTAWRSRPATSVATP